MASLSMLRVLSRMIENTEKGANSGAPRPLMILQIQCDGGDLTGQRGQRVAYIIPKTVQMMRAHSSQEEHVSGTWLSLSAQRDL